MDAIVFSGGGSRGAYQIGVYAALWDHTYRPDIVAGTSVGTVLATMVAAGARPSQMFQAGSRSARRT